MLPEPPVPPVPHYPATAADWRALARRRLPRFLFDYVDGGAGDERTLAANEAAFAALQLRQRVLVDVRRSTRAASSPARPARCRWRWRPSGWPA